MKPMNLLAAALLGAAVLPATAAQFDFYKLGRGVANGDFKATNGQSCTGGDWCSSNVDGSVFGGNLSYTNGGLTAVATGTFNSLAKAVVQDHEPSWTATTGAGLGVYHLHGDTSDDNITAGEVLTITFDKVVKLTSIGLRAEGHNFTGWNTGDTFLFGVGAASGVSTLLPEGTGAIALSQIGQVFTFAYGGAHPNQFYLSAMTAQAVPEPGTYALMLAGLSAVGLAARRRSRRG